MTLLQKLECEVEYRHEQQLALQPFPCSLLILVTGYAWYHTYDIILQHMLQDDWYHDSSSTAAIGLQSAKPCFVQVKQPLLSEMTYVLHLYLYLLSK